MSFLIDVEHTEMRGDYWQRRSGNGQIHRSHHIGDQEREYQLPPVFLVSFLLCDAFWTVLGPALLIWDMSIVRFRSLFMKSSFSVQRIGSIGSGKLMLA